MSREWNLSRKKVLIATIEAMKKDIDLIKEEIVWILETKSEDNIPEKCIPKVRKEDSASQPPRREQLLESDRILSRMVNGVSFKNVICCPVNDKLLIYKATGITQFITFQMEIELEEDRHVKRLVFEFENENIEEVLGRWRKKFVRAKNFQILVEGCAKFSEQFSRMNTVLTWFFQNKQINKLFRVEDTDIRGTLLKSIQIDEDVGEPLLTVRWKIEWNPVEYKMGDVFLLGVSNATLFDKKAISYWREFCEKRVFSDVDIESFFISMADSLKRLQANRT